MNGAVIDGRVRTMEGVLRAGGAGVVFANSIWDTPRPQALARAVAGMVHEEWSVGRAIEYVGQ